MRDDTNSVPEVKWRGEIDISNLPEAKEALLKTLDNEGLEGKCVLLNLLDVKYIDSEGIKVILEAQFQANDSHQSLLIVASCLVKRIMKVTNVLHLFDVYPNIDEALATA